MELENILREATQVQKNTACSLSYMNSSFLFLYMCTSVGLSACGTWEIRNRTWGAVVGLSAEVLR